MPFKVCSRKVDSKANRVADYCRNPLLVTGTVIAVQQRVAAFPRCRLSSEIDGSVVRVPVTPEVRGVSEPSKGFISYHYAVIGFTKPANYSLLELRGRAKPPHFCR